MRHRPAVRLIIRLAVLIPLATLRPFDLTAQQPANPPISALSLTQAEETVEELAARIKPSIAVITFDGRTGEREGLGSGFVIDANGLIATNLHVIGEARPIRVQLADGRTFDVKSIEATDRLHDLAILKVEAQNLPALTLGNSDELQEGASVIAIGNPLGLERSIVTGVLSGRREVDGRPMLQIAMPIEQGNSGGPLLDRQGRVHGLITLKSLKTENLGFAAPVNHLKPLLTHPNPVAMSQWLTIGVLNPDEWSIVSGHRWKQRAGRIVGEGLGAGFGGRSLCLSTRSLPGTEYEVAASVQFNPADGAAGLVFAADGGDRHYGFYASNGELRLTRFDGPDVYAWTILAQVKSPHFRESGWNHLKVAVTAQRIACYVNDQRVIESTDTTYRSGRAGLCKFRNTKAEFREFMLATSIAPHEPSPQMVERVTAAVPQLSLTQPVTDELARQFIDDGALGQEALERQARELEARARRVRELAATVHEIRIRDAFAAEVGRDDGLLDLLQAALLVAQVDNPELDIAAYRQQVDSMAQRVRKLVPENANASLRLQALKKHLFEEQGFHGSRHDYDHRSNSYLNEVIDDREGLPITLSILFMELGRRLELPIVGIGLPGHFVVQYLPIDGTAELIDVFDRGRSLSPEEARQRVVNAVGAWDADYLQPATKRSILQRMLRNLFSEARAAQDAERMLRYTQLILILSPDSSSDRFYRAVLALQSERLELARSDADWLLNHDVEGISRRTVEDLSRAIDRARQESMP